MFTEIKELFRREKIYFALLLLVLFFYSFLFFAHKSLKHERIPDEGTKRIEALLRDAPQEPEVLRARLAQRPRLALFVQLFTFFFITAFCLGIWFGSRDLWRWLGSRGGRAPTPSGRKPEVSWGISEVIKVAVLFFSSAILLNLFSAFLQFLFRFRWDSSFLMMSHTLVLDTVAVGLVLTFIRRTGVGLGDFVGSVASGTERGIKRLQSWGREIWVGVRTYFVVLPIFAGILIVLIVIATLVAYNPPPHPLVEVLLKEEKLSFGMVFSSLLVACVVGPIVEEIFFRGFFYPALRRYWGVGWAMVITAGLFAVVHENLFAFLPIFFLGLALCYLYELRRNLVSCITLHIVHNSAFIAYFFLMKSVLLGMI